MIIRKNDVYHYAIMRQTISELEWCGPQNRYNIKENPVTEADVAEGKLYWVIWFPDTDTQRKLTLSSYLWRHEGTLYLMVPEKTLGMSDIDIDPIIHNYREAGCTVHEAMGFFAL